MKIGKKKVNSIKLIIEAWKYRQLSMVGKILIVKCLMASQLTYVSSVIVLPEHVITQLNSIFHKFVWRKGERVKRKTLMLNYDQGGLRMVDLKSFLYSLQMSWVKKMLNNDISAWKNIAFFHIGKFDIGMDIFNCNCSLTTLSKQCIDILNKLPSFYKMLIQIWFKCNTVKQIKSIENHNNQVIWNNEHIRYNGKTIHFKLWIKSGIIKINQLFGTDGKMLDVVKLRNKMPHNGRLLMEYLALINAIPKDWKCVKHPHTEDKCIYLRCTDRDVNIDKTTVKTFKKELMKKVSVIPICQHFWERKYPNFSFNWNKIWNNIPSTTREGRLISLNWKITSNIYPTKILLHKMKIENNDVCDICNEKDYVEHFFFFCKKIQPIWVEANYIISLKVSKRVVLTHFDVLFGFQQCTEKTQRDFITSIIMIAKLTISKFRYGNHPNLLFLFKSELRFRKLIDI